MVRPGNPLSFAKEGANGCTERAELSEADFLDLTADTANGYAGSALSWPHFRTQSWSLIGIREGNTLESMASVHRCQSPLEPLR